MIVGEPSKGEDEYFKSIKKLALENDPHNKIILPIPKRYSGSSRRNGYFYFSFARGGIWNCAC
jgi:hypothetical protein